MIWRNKLLGYYILLTDFTPENKSVVTVWNLRVAPCGHHWVLFFALGGTLVTAGDLHSNVCCGTTVCNLRRFCLRYMANTALLNYLSISAFEKKPLVNKKNLLSLFFRYITNSNCFIISGTLRMGARSEDVTNSEYK